MLDERPRLRTPWEPRWSVAVGLILVNLAVFTLQLAEGWGAGRLVQSGWERWAALVPDDLARGHVWQLVTFQFLHGSVPHLVFNCMALCLFGRPVELTLGPGAFLRLYLASGVVGGLLQASAGWVFPQFFGAHPTVGASAGVAGIVGAFAALNWDRPITLFAWWMPVSVRGKNFALATLAITLLFLLQRDSQLANAAHLGGLLTGVACVRLLLPAPAGLIRWRRPRRPAPRPRELVRVPSVSQPEWKQAKHERAGELPPAEFISREVDPILEKVSAHGLRSLTERERQVLEQARRRLGEK